ncbi:hypothetical protein BREVNS_2037 [Brevinematales bacterium NS]|nr:hypothetical protein BREVNS_2037 [Brevinematales bacterium NS]
MWAGGRGTCSFTPFFSVPHFDFAQYPPGRFCGCVSFAVEWGSPSEVRAQEVPGRHLLLLLPASPPKCSRGDPALAGNRRSEVGVLLPKSGGQVDVAHGGRTSPGKRKKFFSARKSGPLSVRGACVACDEDNNPLLPRAGALRGRRKMGNKSSPKLKEERWLNKYSVFV